MDQEEKIKDSWKNLRDEWLPYLKNDVLSLAFAHARYTKNISTT